MNHRTIAALMEGVAPVVKDTIADVFRGISERLSAVERREPIKGEQGERGIDGAPGERGEKGDPGEKGDRGDPGEKGERGEAGPAGVDGKDGADGLPGKDGVDGKDGAPGERGEKGEPGLDGKDGAPGIDGRDGIDGKDGVPGERGEKGDPGRDGRDASDLGVLKGIVQDLLLDSLSAAFANMKIEAADFGRTMKFTIPVGDAYCVHTLKMESMIYRGVWRENKNYDLGDTVTYGGSLFVALQDTSERPETSKHWQLAAKRGQHGRDGKDGKDGMRGPEGKPGRDLTHFNGGA